MLVVTMMLIAQLTHYANLKRNKMGVDVAMGVDYGVASSWSKFICNPKELEWSPKIIVSFRGEHLEWVQTSRLAPISSKGKP